MKKFVFVALAVFLIGGATISSYVRTLYKRIVVTTPPIPLPFVNPITPTPDPLAPYSVLVLGYGGPNHDGGYLTDTMIVAHIVPRQKIAYIISLPRDIWMEFPLENSRTKQHKINSAFAVGNTEFREKGGGGVLSKYAAGFVTGLPIDYFIAVSFAGFEKAIDVLGGIDVDVPHTFDDYLYPIASEKTNTCEKSEEDIQALTATLSANLIEKEFPCRYEHLHFEQGMEHMDGARALKFARTRKSETYGGDFNRSLRQQALLMAVRDKIVSLNFLPKIIPLVSALTRDMQTDITAAVFSQKMAIHPDITGYNIEIIHLNENVFSESKSQDGQYILVPKESWEKVHEYIQSQIPI